MTTEEKARAYDKALERAKKLHKGLEGYNSNRKVIENIFPELAESEDERIRKWLVDYFKEVGNSWIHRDISPEQILSYLEKNKINTEGDFGRGYDCGYQAGYAVAMNEMKPKVTTATLDSEKQKEQKQPLSEKIRPISPAAADFIDSVDGMEKCRAIEILEDYLKWAVSSEEECRYTWKELADAIQLGINAMKGQKPAELSEKQDYSGLSDLERAIHRGFLCAGVENVPRGIIEDTAKEALVYARGLIKDELAKRHLEGYIMGREDTMREMRDFIESHFNCEKAKGPNPPAINIPTWTPPCYYGGPCTNPFKDCINCPRSNMVITPNTSSGTSTATLHGNTSATDGKEHNPSFTD